MAELGAPHRPEESRHPRRRVCATQEGPGGQRQHGGRGVWALGRDKGLHLRWQGGRTKASRTFEGILKCCSELTSHHIIPIVSSQFHESVRGIEVALKGNIGEVSGL